MFLLKVGSFLIPLFLWHFWLKKLKITHTNINGHFVLPACWIRICVRLCIFMLTVFLIFLIFLWSCVCFSHDGLEIWWPNAFLPFCHHITAKCHRHCSLDLLIHYTLKSRVSWILICDAVSPWKIIESYILLCGVHIKWLWLLLTLWL